MSTPFTGPVATEIERRLRAALSPTRLVVRDDSELHRGHAGHSEAGESHFTVEVEAPGFAGLARVARQRLVNRALDGMMDPGGVHALAIKATAPGE